MDNTAGENLAVLRKARGFSVERLSRAAGGVSASLIHKIEQGERTATPPVVAALARAMRITPQRIYGQPFSDPSEQSEGLNALRNAVRRYKHPSQDVPAMGELEADLEKAEALKAGTRYSELLRMLPSLLERVTATAMTAGGDAGAWTRVADAYSCAYAVAHRLNQPDLADLIVSRQHWAANQTWAPEAEVGASWNEAGVHQSSGDYADGLAVVEDAIIQYEEAAVQGPQSSFALGSLHLRGIVLASRARDKAATRRHIERAHQMAEGMSEDVLRHTLTFGPGNVALYELAANVELDKPDEAVRMATPYLRTPPAGLRPSRVGRLYIDAARAKLALGDHRGAEETLLQAFNVAPQMAQIHPMAREVLRVLFISHQRSRPGLIKMAEKAGLTH